MDDTISRAAALAVVEKMYKMCEGNLSDYHDLLVACFTDLTSAQPEITYQTCSDALLKMWMDNVLTNGEYNRIMGRLNAWKGEQDG